MLAARYPLCTGAAGAKGGSGNFILFSSLSDTVSVSSVATAAAPASVCNCSTFFFLGNLLRTLSRTSFFFVTGIFALRIFTIAGGSLIAFTVFLPSAAAWNFLSLRRRRISVFSFRGFVCISGFAMMSAREETKDWDSVFRTAAANLSKRAVDLAD